MKTDKLSYALGESVTITLSVLDTSSEACNNTTGVLATDCYDASASNNAGQTVWDFGSSPDSKYACPADGMAAIPGNWTKTVLLSWSQDECTQPVTGPPSAAACPQTQVPPGSYEIAGGYGPVPPPPVMIQITPK